MSKKNPKVPRSWSTETRYPEVERDAFSRQRPHFSFFIAVFLFAGIICPLIHVQSFSTTHIEGDETVYLTLSLEVNWNLTHHATMDDPKV